MPSERDPSDEVLELAAADSRPDKGIDTEEIDQLLDLAGEIQEKIDKLSGNSRFLFALVLLATVTATFATLVEPEFMSGFFFVDLAMIGISGLAMVTGTSTILRTNRALAREERKLEEILDIVREVATAITSGDLVRPLTKARIRMRISEYPLARSNSRLPPVVRALLGTDL